MLQLPALHATDDPVVFKSDVAMTRVDAQVTDSDGRIITGLEKSDFVLRLNGRTVPIRNFASENVPIDILLLLDVSGSMQPHVQRIAYAAQQALNVLAPHDRIAVMVFDTRTRVKLGFTSSHADVATALDRVLRSESFHGGTFITGSLISAADYVQHQARPDARRAIVILTDDETQDSEDEPRVESALERANAVLSFLQAPYEPPQAGGYPGGGRRGGTWGGGGGSWPGGVGWPGGGGGIGLPGGRGPIGGNDRSHTAGTADIAADTGGDTMRVDDAGALQDTLSRLRQRYALYFYLPEGTKDTDQHKIQVDLAQEARIRYAQAEIRYRHAPMMGNGSSSASAGPTLVTHAPAPSSTVEDEPTIQSPSLNGRRVMVNEDSSPRVNLDTDVNAAPQQQNTAPASNTTQPPATGWPRSNPNKPPQ
ncbi:MAG: VWA domain-containing protein [Acidobacteriaceae bacterium]|nr:VWA domain-containing protein [Acidobacteriaceae bacterium]